jgi:hypothetical protein
MGGVCESMPSLTSTTRGRGPDSMSRTFSGEFYSQSIKKCLVLQCMIWLSNIKFFLPSKILSISKMAGFLLKSVLRIRIRIRIRRIRMFLGSWIRIQIRKSEVWIRILLSPSKNSKKNLDYYRYCFFLTFYL